MKASPDDIKKLLDKTGAGILDCKKAFEETGGNIEEAVKLLRKKGAAVVAKRSGRTASEGVIGEYIHFNKKIGVMVELNCETDFVAKNEKFNIFAHELAMHIAVANPRWLTSGEVPEKVIEDEKEIYKNQLEQENKPENIIDKIIEGKMKKFYEQNCLLNQPWAEDEKISVEQAVKDIIHATGENIQVARFVRFQVGDVEE
jgi:elongation factor Ts